MFVVCRVGLKLKALKERLLYRILAHNVYNAHGCLVEFCASEGSFPLSSGSEIKDWGEEKKKQKKMHDMSYVVYEIRGSI